MPAVNFSLEAYTPHTGGPLNFILQEIGGPSLPAVNAGVDVSGHTAGTPFVRTATEDDGGSPITQREWRVLTGPAQVDEVVSTAAEINWTPTIEGGYVLQYQAINSVGPGIDTVSIVVGTSANVLHYFMIGGQSNAIYTTRELDQVDYPEPGTVYNYTGVALEGMDGKGGFAAPFGKRYYELTGNRVLFDNQAIGAAAQQYLANTNNHWSEAPTPNRYTFARQKWLETRNEVEALGYTVILKGLLWDQGGRDAIQMMAGTPGVTAEEYEDQFIKMIARLRDETGIPDLPIYIVRLGRRSTGDVPEWAAIRQKQDDIVASQPNVHFIHTAAADWPLEMYFDLHHYVQAGYNDIGHTGAEYVAALEAPPVDISPTSIVSGVSVGTPTIQVGSLGDTLSPSSIPSTAVVGQPEIEKGIAPGEPVEVAPTSIPSSAQVGQPTIQPGLPNEPTTLTPATIGSTASVGTPSISVTDLDDIHEREFATYIDKRIYAGSSGYQIKLTLLYEGGVYDPGLSTEKGLIIRKKNGQPIIRENVTISKDKDGRLSLTYRTEEVDFAEPGNYRIQGFGSDHSSTWFSIIKRVRVYPSLLEV